MIKDSYVFCLRLDVFFLLRQTMRFYLQQFINSIKIQFNLIHHLLYLL